MRQLSIASLIAFVLVSLAYASDPIAFTDNFEHGLSGWEIYGDDSARIVESGDSAHGRVLVLHPVGDAYALVKGTSAVRGLRLEGDVLFPTETDNYLGVVYNFRRTGRRTDFGLIYIKGNDSYLSVNPHRDFNVGRTLYPEYQTPLKDAAAIHTNKWQHFKVEVIGSTCHFYVGDMTTPQLTFDDLELTQGSIGLQSRSVGGDVWVDNVKVTTIAHPSYEGRRPGLTYEPHSLLTAWEVSGPFPETQDGLARHSGEGKWRPYPTDTRGAVITAKTVDYHGPRTVAYFRSQVHSDTEREAFLEFSTVDELGMWLNGRFWWFVPRTNAMWYDFATNPKHQGQRIPVTLHTGDNEIVLRVRGGIYASGGFMVWLVP